MLPVIRTIDFDRDVRNIYRYIAADSPDGAASVLRRIERTIDTCAMFPRSGTRRDRIARGLRSMPAGSYVVFYKVIAGEVVLYRVIHGARNLRRAFHERPPEES